MEQFTRLRSTIGSVANCRPASRRLMEPLLPDDASRSRGVSPNEISEGSPERPTDYKESQKSFAIKMVPTLMLSSRR